MTGRDVTIPSAAHESQSLRRALATLAAALALLAIGIAIGSRLASSREPTPIAADTNPVPRTTARRAQLPRATARTPSGAIDAAARSITAFDGPVLLEPARLDAVVSAIASGAARSRLLAAFEEGGARTRATLGADTVPKPVIVLRSVPVGYRIERYSPDG